MANPKKVYFYKIKIKNKPPRSGEHLKPEEIKDLFREINGYNEKGIYFSYELNFDIEKTVVELISVENLKIFGRIGKKEDLNYLHLRSTLDHKSQNINVPIGSYAEKFTYFYYDLDTGILSYLSIQGAPNFRKFDRFLNELCNDNYEVLVIPVSNDNVADFLRGKDIFSGFTVKTTVPVDDFLGCENLGISRSDFIELENAESITIDVVVKSKRQKSISQRNNTALIDILLTKIALNPSIKAKIKASKNNEKPQEHDLIEELFTCSVDMPQVNEDIIFMNGIKQSLIDVYNNNIEDILRMSR